MDKKLTVKILLLLIFSDLLEVFTLFCFKKGAIPLAGWQITHPIDILSFMQTAMSSVFLWLGLFSVMLAFIVWSTILSKIDLSLAVPLASLSYILVPIVSVVWLHETISPLRWAGILFIVVGIVLLSIVPQKANLS